MAALTDGDRIQGYQQPYSLWSDNPDIFEYDWDFLGWWFTGSNSAANQLTGGAAISASSDWYTYPTGSPFATASYANLVNPYGGTHAIGDMTTATAGGLAARATSTDDGSTYTFGGFIHASDPAGQFPRIVLADGTTTPSLQVGIRLGSPGALGSLFSFVDGVSFESDSYTVSIAAADAAYTHIAIVWIGGGNAMKLYVNGSLVRVWDYTSPVPSITNASVAYVLREGGAPPYSSGACQGLFLARGEISPDGIARLANAEDPADITP
jgi:hypothetical protein